MVNNTTQAKILNQKLFQQQTTTAANAKIN